MLGLYSDDLDTLAYGSGISRSAESIGFAAAYGIGSNSSISLMTNLAVSFAVFAVSVPVTCYVAYRGESLEKKTEASDEEVVEVSDREAPPGGDASKGMYVKDVGA